MLSCSRMSFWVVSVIATRSDLSIVAFEFSVSCFELLHEKKRAVKVIAVMKRMVFKMACNASGLALAGLI